MTVFISWSGELSKNIAELLNEWLGNVLQGVKTWISTDDIQKGSIWFSDISEQIGQTRIGILCLTTENVTAPWVLFEAGALSKGVGTSRVCPLLINLSHTELKPPLSQFNGTLPHKEDMLKLVRTINQIATTSPLPEPRLAKAFETWWNGFESDFKSIVSKHQPTKAIAKRTQEDMLAEILEVTRNVQSLLQRTQPASHPRVVLRLPDESEETKLERLVARRIGDLLLKSHPDTEQNQKEMVDRLLTEYLSSVYGSKPAENHPINTANPEPKPSDGLSASKNPEPGSKTDSEGEKKRKR